MNKALRITHILSIFCVFIVSTFEINLKNNNIFLCTSYVKKMIFCSLLDETYLI